MNILVVDDEEVIRTGIERTIRRYFPHYAIYMAADVEEAAELLQRWPMDLVLTDVLMPGMTGLELIELSLKRHSHIQWVVISAHSEFAYAQEAVRLGARDYLLKPIGRDILIGKISELAAEIEQAHERDKEAQLLSRNLHVLRSAVFARLASGLDLGGIDLTSIVGSHPHFQLIMVRMDSDADLTLEHFIVDNVLSELIDQAGEGFVANVYARSLLGLVTLREEGGMRSLIERLRAHLKRYLKIPFQVLHTERMTDLSAVPRQVSHMLKTSESGVYDHCASGGEKAVEVALQYIHARFSSELTLEKVAAVVYLNPVYLSQLFKQKTGGGFKEYVTGLRLERAMEMLWGTELKISDIAERVGYPDVRHFSQVFRKKSGCTPSEFRQRNMSCSQPE
ncbi:response regulator [Paenibacillus sp. J5C_2022]|uniref:response regulator n=1 Tax=Paenibacillus sp. J5C2022 TaxID=2977129 RepID=UPI0021D32A52|nr:response regulator [Paenibacillus sp. J5C2022]MCU6712097.1 response regulator [Paenibacillus sp. J5C2022]